LNESLETIWKNMNEELEMLRRMLAAIVAAEPSRSLAIPTTAIAWADDLEMTIASDERTRSFVVQVNVRNRSHPLAPDTPRMRQVEPFFHPQEVPGPPRRLSRLKP
jgi:hypothetical protein